MDKTTQEKTKLNKVINAYDFYKKNDAATQKAVSSLGFKSVQNMSAKMVKSALTPAKETISPWSILTKPSFIKGALLGASLVYIATNPTVQKAVIAGSVKLWTTIQGNIEEVKEQIQDIKSELSKEEE